VRARRASALTKVRAQCRGRRHSTQDGLSGAAADTPHVPTPELTTLPTSVLAAVAHHTADAVVVTDPQGAIVWTNAAFERLTGYTATASQGCGVDKLLAGDATDRLQGMRLRAAMLSGDAWQGELRHYRRDGTPFWHEVHVSAVAGSGETWRLWIGRDVTERRSIARRFLELSAVVELSIDGILVVDDDHRIRSANAAFARIHGAESGAELHGRRWQDFLPADSLDRLDQEIRPRLLLEGAWQGELTGRRLDGTHFATETSVSQLSGGTAVVVRDITERLEYEDALRRMSLSDPLTGLYNRRGFLLLAQQLLNVASRQHGHTILLYFDLNRFKAINDTHGHAVGDDALVEVAEVLRETFRESDVIARLGGDEFVVLAVNSLDPTGDVLLARLDQRLNAHNSRPGRPYALSIGRGVSCYDPARPQSVEQLLDSADKELLAAKGHRHRFDHGTPVR
jgi:diguanylate cyclase (GGDEF)-like protein/PAS domain S-box-containing protein